MSGQLQVPSREVQAPTDFPELMRGIDGIIWEADARTFVFSYVSPQSRSILGYEPEEWLANPTFWADHLHPLDRDWAVSFCVAQTGISRDHEFEYRMLAKDGRVVWVRDLVWVVRDAAGQPVRLRGLLTDITQRKRAEIRASLQQECTSLLAMAASVGQGIPSLLSAISTRMAWTSATWWRPSEGGLAPAGSWPAGDGSVLGEAERALVARVWETRAPASAAPTPATRAMVAVPIGSGKAQEGVFSFVAADGVHPDDGDVVILAAVGAQVGLFIERERAKEALHASEQRYVVEVEAQRARLDAIIDGVPGAIWEAWGAPGEGSRIKFVSEHGQRMLGYPYQEWTSTPDFWLAIVHPEDRARVEKEAESMFKAGTGGTLAFRWIRKDGSEMWAESWTAIIHDVGGAPAGLRGVTMDVTDRRRAEEERDGARVRLGQILQFAGEGIYGVDADGVTTFMNPAALRATGLTEEEAVGRKLHPVIHHTHADGRPYPSVECPIYMAAHGGETAYCEEDVFFTKDGKPFPVEYVTTPIREGGKTVGAVTVFKDVTERRKLAAALEHERQLLQAIMGQMPAGMVVAEIPSGRLLVANEQFNRILGHEFKPVEGFEQYAQYPALRLDGTPLPLEEYPLVRVLRTGAPVIGQEVLFRRGDGEIVRLLVNAAPVQDPQGRAAAAIATFMDVTELSRTKDALRARAEELARVAEALQRSNEELDQFAYVTSHDLKAPLRGIANLSRWIEEDLAERITPETRGQLELLRGRVMRMEGLIDAILQYSRVGRVKQASFPVAVDALLRETVDLVSPPAGFHVEISPGMPVLEAPRSQLQQVFINLIANAVKHHDKPQGIIRIDCEDAGDHWRFSVVDDGPGIDPRFHEKVFVIFQTLRPRDRVEGTGVGLALVKKIVETNGGEVWLESEVGKGATFRFTWPKDAQR